MGMAFAPMACNSAHRLFHKIRHSTPIGASHTTLSSLSFPFLPTLSASPKPSHLFARPMSFSASSSSSSDTISATETTGFTWNDVVRIPQPDDDLSDLRGFSDKIKFCNRGSEMQSEFIPFVIEDQTVGYIHNLFAEHLRRFEKVFIFTTNNANGRSLSHVTLNSSLKAPSDRTAAVGEVVKTLGEQLIPGIRNELYPVSSSFGGPVFFSLERAAAPYFGIRAYGVHMNGYVEKGGQKFLWIAKRSQTKSTYPGMLDHLVAGGLPHGIACGENIVKECEEEAGIPRSISTNATPVGAVSYMDIEGYRFKRDFLFCYDLKLPESFVPKNEDGEVESFKLIPVAHVANIIRQTYFFKANCCVVIIDFLFRHGYIRPESYGYLDLLQSLRSGNFSQ